MLERAVRSAGSGELVTATDVAEVHVYVLAGRIAWGTSSSTRSAFTQHLIEHCGLDREALREAITESQRSRSRLGETLVSWGLVSKDDLRVALRVQVQRTLEELLGMAECQALFLPRHMDYDEALTFSLEEVFPDRQRASIVQRAVKTGVITDLARAFPDARWASVVADGAISASTTELEAAHARVLRLDALLTKCQLRSVVLRSAFGSILGAHDTARLCSLWVALPAEAKLGVAVSVLGATASSKAPEPAMFSPTIEVKVFGRSLSEIALSPMRQAMMGAEQMLAVFVTDNTGEQCGLTRVGIDPSPITSLAHEGNKHLAESCANVFVPAQPRNDLTYEHVALSMDRGACALFQTRLPQKPNLTLSLVFECGTTPGLAWALLGTLSRQLND